MINIAKVRQFWPAALVVTVYAAAAAARPLLVPDELSALNLTPAFFGDSILAARLPAVAATLLSGLAVAGFARLRSRRSAWFAAMIYFGSFAVFAAGTAATGLPVLVLCFQLLVLGGCAAFFLDGMARRLGLAAILLGGIGFHFSAGVLRSGVFADLAPEPLLIAALLPFLPFWPLWITVLRKAPFREEPLLLSALVLAVFSLALGLVLPAAGVLGAMGSLALAGGYAMARYFTENPDPERFSRNLRSSMMMIASGVVLLLALPWIGPGREPYYLPALAGIIWLVWIGYGRASRNPLWQFGGFMIGLAFVYLVLPRALPARLMATRDFVAPLHAYDFSRFAARPQIYTEPELLGFVRRQLPGWQVEALDPSFQPGDKPILVISRLGEITAKLPPATRRTVYKPSNLAFTEYNI
ncbi:MAG: hypothetical protein AB7F32_03320 [Victivallaceae bacterium]